jgi:hypothetical protein
VEEELVVQGKDEAVVVADEVAVVAVAIGREN